MFHTYKSLISERLTQSAKMAPRASGIQRWQLLLVTLLILGSFQSVRAQLQVTLSSSTMGANVCGPRTLTAVVNGGSGNYSYFWNSNPSSSANLGNGNTITVEPTVYTTFQVGVYDMTTGAFQPMSVGVYPAIKGAFSTYIPDVFTPNGDGVNDRWEVRDANKGSGPIKAYAWSLQIKDRNNKLWYQSSYTDTNAGAGINGGQIYWDGHGAINATYYYYLTLYNCDNPNGQLYTGNISIFGPITAVIAEPTQEQMAIYPNPTANELTISPAQLLRGDIASTAGAKKAVASTPEATVGTYEVKLIDKFNQTQRSITSKEAEVKLDVRTLPEGTYFLQVTQGRNTTRRQIVVSH